MKFSIVTVAMNGAGTIEDAIDSVAAQTYGDVEHVIVDGGSTDGTVEIIKRHNGGIARWVSEPDRGIYDAMNKGITMATGDVIGMLNADDVYADERVLEDIASSFAARGVDSCYGDLVYVDRKSGRVVRYWRAGECREGLFKKGWHPPHPTFFVRRAVYEKYGLFDQSLTIAADYEIMLRFLVRHRISAVYIPRVIVKMRDGGVSNRSIRNIVLANAECYLAWKRNGLAVSPMIAVRKPISKLFQRRLFR